MNINKNDFDPDFILMILFILFIGLVGWLGIIRPICDFLAKGGI
jgi:hypothetical protein